MARDINKYLNQLRDRRTGGTQVVSMSEAFRNDSLGRAPTMDSMLKAAAVVESWQKRAANQPFTRYALGAMQEVGPDYTRISVETAERVGGQLETALTAAGIPVAFRLQGSVPLNVHIRGVSDVDLLTIETSFYTYSPGGAWGKAGHYKNSTTRTSVGVLSALRREAEKTLKDKYPAAKVDTAGGKAINISGGSLARAVDVVPAHWFDSASYQATGQAHDRAVTIFNKKTQETIDNFPFLHIKLITDRCNGTLGGLRKAIRLCKNVKADAESDGKEITLPSFDIAAAMYHADKNGLMAGYNNELAILAETQRHLDALATDHAYAKTLRVPDGSRLIFDTAAKLNGLTVLSTEIDALLQDVAAENAAFRKLRSLPEARLLLLGTPAPAAWL
jgi:hypothetical protein